MEIWKSASIHRGYGGLILESRDCTYPGMAPVLIPYPRSVSLVNHDGVNILSRSEVFASPIHGGHLRLGRVVRVHAATPPGARELLGLDRFELVEKSEGLRFGDVLTLDQVFDLLFRRASDSH